jgi:histidyl-tRNA synthetase
VGETTDIVEKEMYTFRDKGDRSMTLRPEWTAPVVRAVLEHNLLANGPQRLYYVGPIYRYERPQAGRYRQAHQFGVECLGYEQPAADAEVIQLAHELLRSHGAAATLHLNSIGCAECRSRFRTTLIAYFKTHEESLSEDSRRRLERNPLRILDSKAPRDQELLAHAPGIREHLCQACLGHFSALRTLLDDMGIPYQDDPHIVRGLDYYTRTVFEFISDDLGTQSTVCAGGRYDGLIPSLGGPETPAVGFALGIERFLMLTEQTGASATEREGIAVVPLGEAARSYLLPLTAMLRGLEQAPPITIAYGDASLTSHFKKADRAGARAALIVGEDELRQGKLVLRNLSDRTQQTLEAHSALEKTAHLILERYHALDASAVLA